MGKCHQAYCLFSSSCRRVFFESWSHGTRRNVETGGTPLSSGCPPLTGWTWLRLLSALTIHLWGGDSEETALMIMATKVTHGQTPPTYAFELFVLIYRKAPDGDRKAQQITRQGQRSQQRISGEEESKVREFTLCGVGHDMESTLATKIRKEQ